MRLFLINLGQKLPEQVAVARALKKNHEILYWIRMRKHFTFDENEFTGTVFHEYLDALKCIPAPGVDTTAFEPWSREDIAAYSKTESEFMSMADKWYPDWPVNQRKDLYYDMLCYWSAVLERFAPDCIIFLGTPHEMYSFVMYSIAKARGIRTVILDNAVMEVGRYMLINDYAVGHIALANYKAEGNVVLEDLSQEMREYYTRISNSTNPATPMMNAFARDHTLLQNLRRFIRVTTAFIKEGTVVERGVLKLFKLMKPSLKDEYRAHERPADLTVPFVYFPLQYQPEMTTSPLGGVYVDQLLALKTLAAALPAGWSLYVKEHPAQVGVHEGNVTPARYRGFYQSIASIPNVRLIPIRTNTFQLIDRAKATATTTGTAAWESVLRDKPALVLGYPWFMNAPGIFRVGGVDECRAAFAKVANGFLHKKSDIFAFLKRVDSVTICAYLHQPNFGKEGEWHTMYRAIEDALVSKR